MCGLLGLHYLFHPSVEWHCLDKGLCSYSPLGSYFCHSSFFLLACWPYWPIGLVTSFLGLPQPTYFIFTSYSFHELTSCHSCHVGPLGLLPLSLVFLGLFTSSLPLILPMSLLAFILAMLAYWACYLFPWISSAHLLHLYLLFFP